MKRAGYSPTWAILAVVAGTLAACSSGTVATRIPTDNNVQGTGTPATASTLPAPTALGIPTPQPATQFALWMERIPASFAEGGWDIWYADRRHLLMLEITPREATSQGYTLGLEDVAQKMSGRFGEKGAQLFKGIPEPRGLQGNSPFVVDQLGFLDWHKYQDIAATQSRKSVAFPDVLIARWNIDSAGMVTTLQGMGYLRDTSTQTPFWRVLEDYEVNFNVAVTGYTFGKMNRVAMTDGLLVTAPATNVLLDTVNTIEARQPSLASKPVYAAIPAALGEVQAAVVFQPPTRIRQGMSKEAQEQMQQAYAGWGTMRPAQLAAMGYATDGKFAEIRLALAYDDPTAATANVAELKRRWESYTVTYSGDPAGVPLRNVCGPLNAQARPAGTGSVIMATCLVNPDAFLKEKYEGASDATRQQWLSDLGSAASCWYRMIESRDLLFLVPNLRDTSTP